MKQNISNLKAGQIMIVFKNDDGTFSPVGISVSQSIILNKLLSSFSDSEPLVINEEVKLGIVK